MNVVWLTLALAQPGQSVEKVSHEVQSSGFAEPRAAPMMPEGGRRSLFAVASRLFTGEADKNADT